MLPSQEKDATAVTGLNRLPILLVHMHTNERTMKTIPILNDAPRPVSSTADAGLPDIGSGTEGAFQDITIDSRDPMQETLIRLDVLNGIRTAEALRAQSSKDARRVGAGSPERNALYQHIRACVDEEKNLEMLLKERFLPQHGLTQFVSPRAFFLSPLFRVGSNKIARAKHIEHILLGSIESPVIRYEGPELRQSDGLVFMALLHMLRDVRVGTSASFHPENVCMTLLGRYDGNSRKQLREHILRLQRGLMIFERFSVQLCQRFDNPKTGKWTVSLDGDIVRLFQLSPVVWFSLETRLALPEGLATWLLGYIESQSRLIPTKISSLRQLSGSQASEKSFTNRLRDALHHLALQQVIDSGWSVRSGTVRWLKRPG